MPGFWTHIMYGKDVLEEIGLDLEADKREEFNLGCLFTDPGKYCSREGPEFSLWRFSHTLRCDDFAKLLCRKSEEISRFYSLGVICHYFLDATVNHYIVARAGNGYKYRQLETMIDKVILKSKVEADILDLDPTAEFSRSLPAELEDLYREISMEFYGIKGCSIQKAIDSMNQYFAGIYGRSRLALILKRFSIKEGSPEEAFFEDTHVDPLNLEMKPWFHSIAGWESKKTFDELYREAFDSAVLFLQNYLDSQTDFSLPGVSLMTNLPLMEY
ncbi:zinc dependent phospholipase C family protein [Mesotoga sp. UBA6090]|uniref:zinc dependent phospholipase C family protein n=1 Tax=Mesotoga sp. UBA6090 TaxID=1946860 RepID=UPI0025FE81DE|nr:zinc dependent phospholipase C family protein [Mesotoga sp. UBA6090]